MKIAVACVDGGAVSPHFGRSRYFLVFEEADGEILTRETRENACTCHAEGRCGDGEQDHASHSHDDVAAVLGDCDVVLCGGMGPGARQALAQHGIAVVTGASTNTPENLVKAYLSGTLQLGGNQCGH